jgi:hypothetical protein
VYAAELRSDEVWLSLAAPGVARSTAAASGAAPA